jgi:hypothetical protein
MTAGWEVEVEISLQALGFSLRHYRKRFNTHFKVDPVLTVTQPLPGVLFRF